MEVLGWTTICQKDCRRDFEQWMRSWISWPLKSLPLLGYLILMAQELDTSASGPSDVGNVQLSCRVPLLWVAYMLPCCFRHYSTSHLHAIKYTRHRKSVRQCSSVISKDTLHCLAFKIALPKWAFHNWASKFSFYSLFMYYATIRINYAASSWEEIRFQCELEEERERCTSHRKVTVSYSSQKRQSPSLRGQISDDGPQLS